MNFVLGYMYDTLMSFHLKILAVKMVRLVIEALSITNLVNCWHILSRSDFMLTKF